MSQLSQPQQAMLIWPVLAQAARMQRVLTYSELEGFTGIFRNGQGVALGLIKAYCERKGYPKLNTIVVLEETGFPGYPEQVTATEFLTERARVFAFNWPGKEKPRPEDFESAASVSAKAS